MIRILTEWSPDALERSVNELISANPGSRVVGISSHYVQDIHDDRPGAAYAEYVAAVEMPAPPQACA